MTTVVVSVLEIYNEIVRGLLSLQHTEKMEIKLGTICRECQVQVTCQKSNRCVLVVYLCICNGLLLIHLRVLFGLLPILLAVGLHV